MDNFCRSSDLFANGTNRRRVRKPAEISILFILLAPISRLSSSDLPRTKIISRTGHASHSGPIRERKSIVLQNWCDKPAEKIWKVRKSVSITARAITRSSSKTLTGTNWKSAAARLRSLLGSKTTRQRTRLIGVSLYSVSQCLPRGRAFRHRVRKHQCRLRPFLWASTASSGFGSFSPAVQKLNRQSDKQQERGKKCIAVKLRAARKYQAYSEQRQRGHTPPQNGRHSFSERSLRYHRKRQHQPRIEIAERKRCDHQHEQEEKRKFDCIALCRPHIVTRHRGDKQNAERQSYGGDDRVDDRKLKVRDVYVNRFMRCRSSIGIDAAKQPISHAYQGLIFPSVAAHRALAHTDFAVSQHSGAPLLEVMPRALKSSKRRWYNEKQEHKCRRKA